MADLSLRDFEQVHENLGSGGKQKNSECFIVDFGNMKSREGKKNLQESFLKFKKQKQKEIRDERRLRAKRMRQQGDEGYMNKLRKKFVKRAKKYYGVPYAKKYWSPDTPEYKSKQFLDCCGLVRQVMWDLRKDFGFKLGPWNQAYMYDLLPVNVEKEEDMKPGDLVFISGIYPNPKARQQKHFMTHVEIWAGSGNKTIGARWNNGKVQLWDSYKFEAKSFHSAQYHFKSIDTWLQGICRSFCPTHKWKRGYNPNKKSIFSVDDQQKSKVKTSDQQGQGHSEPVQGQLQSQQDIQLLNSQQQEEDDERDYEEEEDMEDVEDEGPLEAACDSDNGVESQLCTPREGLQGTSQHPQLPHSKYFLDDGPTRQQYYQGQEIPMQNPRSSVVQAVPFSNKRYQTQIGFALSLNSRKQAPPTRAGTSLGMQHQEKQETVVRPTDTEVLLQRLASLEVSERYQTFTPKPHPRSSTARHRPLGLIDTCSRPVSRSPGCRFPVIYNDVQKQRFDRGRGIQGKHIGPISLRHSPPKLPECTNNSGQSSPEQQDEVVGQGQVDTRRSDSIQTFGNNVSFNENQKICGTVTPGVIELHDSASEKVTGYETKGYVSLCDTSMSQPYFTGLQTDNSKTYADTKETDNSRSHLDNSRSQRDIPSLETSKSVLNTVELQLNISSLQPENMSRSHDDSRSKIDNSRLLMRGDCPVND